MSLFEKAKVIAERLTECGATDCVVIGGFVRDRLLGFDSKDIDIEVYGLGYDEIAEALRSFRGFGRLGMVGRSFGVLKLGNQIDITIPRRESKEGRGHRGFAIAADPTMTPREAAARRDFTINAIGMRPIDGTFIDPFDGQADIERGILRATSEAFKEDPLRVLRGMQMAARLGFDMDEQTIGYCREVSHEFDELSPERVWGEWWKWAVQGRQLSKGLELLVATGWIEHFPELRAIQGVEQNPEWHPEGDVFTHTCLVCNAAEQIATREKLSERDRAVLVFAALCHDFGKAPTTTTDEQGRTVSPRHEKVGIELAQSFLERMRPPGWVVEQVLPLISEHMVHVHYGKKKGPTERVVRRLADRLHPVTIRDWALLVEADASGCPPKPAKKPVESWVEVAEQLKVRDQRPEPILLGRHLLERGHRPGPAMGRIIKAAYEVQLDGEFTDLDGALAWMEENG